MKYEIHFTTPNGDEDHITVEGDSIPEIQQKAQEEVAKRKGTNPWSKEVI